jgi:hypothetical protein
VKTEIDAAGGRRDGANFLEQGGLVEFAGYHVGQKGGHAARRGGGRLGLGILRHTRPAEVEAVSEMDVGIQRIWSA